MLRRNEQILNSMDHKMALHEVKLCLLGVSWPVCLRRVVVPLRAVYSHRCVTVAAGERRREDVYREQVRFRPVFRA